MKKFLVTIFIFSMVLFAGCGSGEDNGTNVNNDVNAAANGDVNAAANGDVNAAANSSSHSSDEVFEIKEKLFIAQTNDIYINPKDYLGKTLKYEGMYSYYTDEMTGETYHYVVRYGPGCCAYDENAGFEVIWEDASKDYPKTDDWVEVVGVLDEISEDGYNYLVVRLASLNVLDERGEEYVYQ